MGTIRRYRKIKAVSIILFSSEYGFATKIISFLDKSNGKLFKGYYCLVKSELEAFNLSVIARNGGDYTTIENYTRKKEEKDAHTSSQVDPRYFFRMYGFEF